MIETPLGPLVDDIGAQRVRPRRPAGRDRASNCRSSVATAPTGDLSVSDIADVLRAHLRADDVLAPYADRLADPSLDRTLRGYLTGSLDLVLRLPGDRFAVVDYKTNWLGGSSGHERPMPGTTGPSALTAEMYRAHYPLQALLYSVALHRYLRWRLPAYDPTQTVRRRPLPVRAGDEQPQLSEGRKPAVRGVGDGDRRRCWSNRSVTSSSRGRSG